jgi:hypothetical protein
MNIPYFFGLSSQVMGDDLILQYLIEKTGSLGTKEQNVSAREKRTYVSTVRFSILKDEELERSEARIEAFGERERLV